MDGDNNGFLTALESYLNALPAYAPQLFKTEMESRTENALQVICVVETAVGIDFWRTASVTDKLYILDLADGINNAGFRHMNINDIVEEMKHIILNNSTNTVVDAWCWVTVMSGIFGEGTQREVNPRNMDNIRAAIVTDVQLLMERNNEALQPTVIVEATNNQHVNQLLEAAVQADSSVMVVGGSQVEMLSANTDDSIENMRSHQTNTIVQELSASQVRFLECGTTSREAMALPAVVPGKSNPYQVLALVTDGVISETESQSDQQDNGQAVDETVIIDVSPEELREVEEIEETKPSELEGTIRFGNVVSSGKYAYYCASLMDTAVSRFGKNLIRDLRKALIREVNGQEAIALYIMLYDETTQTPYAPGISIFKEMLCKDKMSKRIMGNIGGKFDFLSTFDFLTTASKGWSDFMKLSAVKAFKLDDIYYLMMTEKGVNETVAYVDVWGEKCQAKQDGIFEEKQVQNVYMFSEPVQLRDNVILRYIMYWGEQSGLHKGIIISGSLVSEPNRMYNAVFLNETTGKGFINWKLSEAVFKNIVMREGPGFFDKSYEASDAYYDKYGQGLEGYTPLNIETPSQGSTAYRAGRLFGRTVRNIDYAAEVITEAPGRAVDAAKRTAENIKTGVTEAYKDAAAGFKETMEDD